MCKLNQIYVNRFTDVMSKQDLVNFKVVINKDDLNKFSAIAKSNAQYQ